MATLSTLRIHHAGIAQPQHRPHHDLDYDHDQEQVSRPDTGTALVPSILHNEGSALPIGNLFGQDSMPSVSPAGTLNDPWENHNQGGAPCDGEKIWFCSACGDGPTSAWQNCCVTCGHVRCSECKIEETS
jgi:hypothetical protein